MVGSRRFLSSLLLHAESRVAQFLLDVIESLDTDVVFQLELVELVLRLEKLLEELFCAATPYMLGRVKHAVYPVLVVFVLFAMETLV